MRSRFISLLVVLAFTAFPVVVSADAPENIGHVLISSTSIDWLGSLAHDELTLTVQMPDGTNFSKSFNSAAAARLGLNDIPGRQDGIYHYDLRLTPRIPAGVRQALANARAQNNDAAIKQLKNDNGLNQEVVQSGVFSISNGSFVSSSTQEQRTSGSVTASAMRPAQSGGGNESDGSGTYNILANRKLQPKVTDQVIADDLIVQGSLCVGFDCVNGESFGFDTIRLKENNLRITFTDTSTGTFPSNDWTLTANDSASGGANKFSIDDVTGVKTPFTITAGAPTNSTFVASTGKVGFRNSAPGLDLHVTTGDTPAMRLEQTNASGFTAQTWDIAGNEANFFVRDLTGGSRLPFRIRPGAPTSSVDISASGNVGIGTASPANLLDVSGSATLITSRTVNNNSAGVAQVRASTGNGTSSLRQAYFQATTLETTPVDWRAGMIGDQAYRVSDFSSGAEANRIFINVNGQIGIGGMTAPTNPLQHSSGAFLSAGGTWTNASSRDFKQNICDLDSKDAMQTLQGLNPVTYDYKVDPSEHHVGFIAEDVPNLVATKDRKGLSPMDVVAVLTQVVKDQQKTIEEMQKRLDSLEKKN
jgi:hypothetical protein